MRRVHFGSFDTLPFHSRSLRCIEGRAGDGQVCAGRAEGGAEGRATAGEAPPVVARLRPLSAAPQGHLARRDEVSTNVMSCSTGMNVEIWNLAEILPLTCPVVSDRIMFLQNISAR